MTMTIGKRAEFLAYLEQQEAELSMKLRHLEHEIVQTFELREATRKLLEAMK